MGVTTHGGLGEPSFLRPSKKKKYYTYVNYPHRLDFADKFDVNY